MKNSQKKSNIILEQGLYFAWAIAAVATLGSLYFSEVRGYIPCNFCWYQRILMYPLVIILGIAAVKKDYKQTVYVLPLAGLGFCFSLFHYLMQKTSWFDHTESAACGIVPCAAEYINLFGFITIPFLALTAFTMIIILSILIYRESKEQ